MKSYFKYVCFALMVLLAGVSAQNPCDTQSSGNWCYQDGFVSCPTTTVRACNPGLSCYQQSAGTIYCYPPDLIATLTGVTATSAPTTTPTTAPTTPPTSAPVSGCGGDEPTVAPTQTPTQKPTSAPTSTPTQKPTSAPTSTPTSTPTQKPTTTPTSTPTTKPTTGATSAPVSGSWPNGPLKAIYMDVACWSGKTSFTQVADAGYNLLVLAFYMSVSPTTGALHYTDCAQAWQELSAADRADAISYLHTAGVKVIVSVGGATDSSWFSNWASGAAAGTAAAQFAQTYGLDGVDFDLEWFQVGFTVGSMTTAAATVNWICDATNAVHTVLGSSAIVTHAPQPPYFSAAATSTFLNGYGKVYAQCGSAISYYMIQMYNNGVLNTYDAIFGSGYAAWGSSSVSQINAAGVPLSKIVVGKPVTATDADVSGYNTAADLNSFFAQAKTQYGWNAGVMGWQWHDYDTNANWINTIYTD